MSNNDNKKTINHLQIFSNKKLIYGYCHTTTDAPSMISGQLFLPPLKPIEIRPMRLMTHHPPAHSYSMQYQLFKYLTGKDIHPLIIDVNMMHEEPKSALKMICSHCEIPFDPNMLVRSPMANFQTTYDSQEFDDINDVQITGLITNQNDREIELLESCREIYVKMLAHAQLPKFPESPNIYKVA